VLGVAALTPLVLVLSWIAGWVVFGSILVGALWVRIGADAVLAPQEVRPGGRTGGNGRDT
jgi:hypothetical protein